MTRKSRPRAGLRGLAAIAAVTLGLTLVGTTVTAADEVDPRIGLGAGITDAEIAISNMELLSTQGKPEGFFNPASLGSLAFANSDIAFSGDRAFVGNFHGFQVYDVSDPAAPVLEKAFVCPGGQGDLSVYGDLLFMSVEETRGRIDCATGPTPDSTTRFRGVRIFDISDLDNIVQLPGVQTCAGSHTHSLLVPPGDDPESVFIYNSGTAGIRSAAELAGCNGNSSLTDPTTTNFAIQVIEVPLDAPETASVVNNSRIFSVCGDNSCLDDYADGALNGLPGSGRQPTYPADSDRAPGGQSRSQASRCHDITLYPEIGLGAGACQGWGLLLDISDPANPKRIHAVEDYNFAYWHSATFNNDGTKVIFTDEWGGGTGARCRATDPVNWGANALFDIVDTAEGKKMEWASYYKLPVPQTSQENCVAHNGSLVPVPGRDIMVQAWYQGGTSVFDFTDTQNPTEIAFFDRGPNSATQLITGGHWSTYWYNGEMFGSEIARGFDSFALTASAQMSDNEIAAAKEIQFEEVNVQGQAQYAHAPSFAVVRSYVDQAERAGTLTGDALEEVREHLATAEKLLDSGKPNKRAVQAQFDNAIRKAGDNTAVVDAARALWESVR
ncbi:LVIVD repeat-containing protein [Ornithinimicrobium cerasi]|uniref:LVIVD repeat-containing protein n=1 Tax=Ornithinimicrobium cerasi TaxID=2248773 RepID=A0A285VVG2_9MICO|nr:hypothetical protein [Ornithinimicrobium cerasi]SOC57826.1 LVIVD repeat-containing protein [Ornithinimicrobium cerasi]SOC58012.1 LVIVD repeat-containing protein [Ornithinimicrobium cerasi]